MGLQVLGKGCIQNLSPFPFPLSPLTEPYCHIPYLEVPTTVTAATAKEIQTLPAPSDITEKPESTTTKLQTEKLATKSTF
ncbi:hypothetical protein [Nostoc flagelliforme]|nr:hypothetical protein [Nostoc flagelliforme]